MSDKVELLPCPFCGGNNLRIEAFSVQPDNYHSGNVHCEDCEMDGPSGLSLPSGSWSSCKEDGEADGVAAWNRRAALARRPARAVPDGFLLVTPEQVEQHATTAWECPPQSRVVLVSSLKRLHTKNAAPPAAEQQDTVKVPRELLERAAKSTANGWIDYPASKGLRALLGKEGEA